MQFARIALASAMSLLFACGQSQEGGSPGRSAAGESASAPESRPETARPVTGGSAAASVLEAGGSADEETGSVAPVESDATPPHPNVSDGDAASMAANDFGTPVARAADRIEVRRWITDGGGVVTAEPAAGWSSSSFRVLRIRQDRSSFTRARCSSTPAAPELKCSP